jgi:hypothetical protein
MHFHFSTRTLKRNCFDKKDFLCRNINQKRWIKNKNVNNFHFLQDYIWITFV